MARKRALVVDDSKSARMVLRKMLEKHDLDVDTAESAEEALDYLMHTHPSVIFMDHMMPGMDGFQAVKAIKSDPRTATIPIMMYTSKEGDLYVGEARALGAVGVLPKEVKPADLLKVLESLHLISPADAAPQPPPRRPPEPAATAEPLLMPSTKISSIAREAAEDAFQQFLRDELAGLRERLRQDVKDEVEHAVRVTMTETLPARTPRRGLLALALGLVAGMVGGYLLNRPAPLPTAPIAQVAESAPAASVDNTTLMKNLALQRVRADRDRGELLKALEWSLNQAGQWELGQPPFGEERLGMVSELLTRLNAIGFEGLVRLDAHVGQFCFVRDGNGELRLPPADLPLQRCDSIGMEPTQAQSLASRQSLAFANFLGSSPLLRQGRIRLEIVPRGEEMPRYDYPTATSGVTAGQWNSIARRNNRIEVSIIPSP